MIIDCELFDHSTLLLAVSTMADRTGRKFGGAILPDETIVPTDTLFGRAISWLRSGR